MPNHVEQMISRASTPALNDVNDAVCGGQSSALGGLGSLAAGPTPPSTYAAQIGARMILDGSALGVKYDSTIGTLYGGWYQYVQTYVSGTAAPALGLPAVWAWDQNAAAFESYIVSADANSALRTGRVAGFFIDTITKGNYGWIQTKGKATVKFVTSLTAATPADGDLLIVASASGLVDDLTQTTQPTMAQLKAVIGTAIGAPVSNTTGLVLLRGLPDVI